KGQQRLLVRLRFGQNERSSSQFRRDVARRSFSRMLPEQQGQIQLAERTLAENPMTLRRRRRTGYRRLPSLEVCFGMQNLLCTRRSAREHRRKGLLAQLLIDCFLELQSLDVWKHQRLANVQRSLVEYPILRQVAGIFLVLGLILIIRARSLEEISVGGENLRRDLGFAAFLLSRPGPHQPGRLTLHHCLSRRRSIVARGAFVRELLQRK